jgi:hypothetical protein
MTLLIQILRVLCITLLLPATVLAAAQTGHAPTRHDYCEDAAPDPHHGDATQETSGPAWGDDGDRAQEPLHVSCGIHACNWIEEAELIAGCPNGLTWALYEPLAGRSRPAAPRESLYRPPAALF